MEKFLKFVAMMKNLLKNLGFWVLVSMIAGAIVGAVMGEDARMFMPLGSLFIQCIKMLVVPLVILSIIVGAASLGQGRSAGKIGIVSISYILLTTLLSAVIAIILGLVFKPGEGLSLEGTMFEQAAGAQSGEVGMSFWDTIIGMIPSNPFEALATGNVMQLIIFGLLFGFGISALNEEKRVSVVNILNYMLDALVWCIEKVMWVAPFGVFGLLAEAVGSFGFELLLKIANLLWVDLLGVFIMALLVYPLSLMLMSQIGVKTFFKTMLKPQLIAFSTASSLATLPVTMEACEKMGISKHTRGFVIPLGATINMTGNVIYFSLVAVFFAQFYGIELNFAQLATIAVSASLTSIGQAGVPGPTLIVAAVLLSAGIPIDGLPMLYALDRIFDMIRTTLNITGDAVCAAVTDNFVAEKR